MYAKLTAVAVALGAIWLAGCATSSSKLNGVHLGMTKTSLIQKIGAPDSTSGQGNVEYLTYYLKNDATVGNQPYMVRLIDQKVESFGRFIQLPDPHRRNSPGVAALGVGAIMPYELNMDVVTQLQHLKALQNQGVLTAEEVERAKERLFAKVDEQ
jgi:hypothetical protein